MRVGTPGDQDPNYELIYVQKNLDSIHSHRDT